MTSNWKLFQPKFKEIWRVNSTSTDSQSREQKGERPCLVIKEFSDSEMMLVIPFTGVLDAERFSYTVKIKKDNTNKLDSDSVALVFQLKSISKTRLIRMIGRINDPDYKKIEILVKELFRIK